jgi:hypothetical protein
VAEERKIKGKLGRKRAGPSDPQVCTVYVLYYSDPYYLNFSDPHYIIVTLRCVLCMSYFIVTHITYINSDPHYIIVTLIIL